MRSHVALSLSLALVTLLAALPAFAEESVFVQGLNEMQYSFNSDPDRVPTDPEEIFEDYLEADIRFRRFLVGFRYEAFLPPFQSGPDSLRQGFTQHFAAVEFPYGGLRVGNFYGIFGRGLLFRSYEERSIGVDTNMDGVLLQGNVGPLEMKALTGRIQEAQTNERSAVLRGTDLGVDLGWGLRTGGSYLMQSTEDPAQHQSAAIHSPRHIEALGGRVSYTHDFFDVYYEAGRINRLFLTSKDVRVIRENGVPVGEDTLGYDDVRGRGHYAAVNLFPLSGVAITAEYKDYRRFRFRPWGTETDYNLAPAVARETGYTLITRHAHQLDMDDEKGYQVEGVISPPIEGTTITLNRTKSELQNGEHSFAEWYAEWRQYIGERYAIALVYDYTDVRRDSSRNHTPIVEFEYFSGDDWSLRSEYQYQESTTQAGLNRTHFGLLEYHVDQDLGFSLVAEHADYCDESEGTCREKKDDFLYGQIDWFFNQTQHFTLTVGKRQEGTICVGGVCQQVPELQGVELKLVSQF
ncbi:MAG: DUF6029 family protein [Candidatus Eisenbacteria bacterium]